jgi:predicted DNA-binding transcriptional regulator
LVEKILEKLGLSEKEAKVYLAALELGSATVQQIAEKAKVLRPTTYLILESMLKKGLMTSADKGKKTLFSAEPPAQLERYLDHQVRGLEEVRTDLRIVLPDMEALFNLTGERPKVRFYDGIDGLDSSEDDLYRELQPNDHMYCFTPLDEEEIAFPDTRQAQPEKRLEKGIWAHVIYTRQAGPIPEASSKKEKRAARFLPKDKFPFRGLVTIVPNKRVQIASFAGRHFGVLIEDAEIANTFKVIWDLAWEAAEKYQ